MTQSATKKNPKQEGAEVNRVPGTSVLEWVVAGVSAVCLVAVIAYLVVIALDEPSSAPAFIEVTAGQVTESESGYVLEFSAVNRAAGSVAGVQIDGRLLEGAEVVEEASVTLDYLPKQSEQKGALIFRSDPRGHEILLRATGYFEP